VKVFGIDPGSERTGYGCVESDGSHHRLITCGAIVSPALSSFPDKLLAIHTRLAALLAECRPDCVAIENLFFAVNVRSALKLGHARGVAMLAAVEAGVTVVEYTPAEIKRAVVGYGRAEKHQVQQMVKLVLGLSARPSPHDAADALAVAICHLHSRRSSELRAAAGIPRGKAVTSWRHFKQPAKRILAPKNPRTIAPKNHSTQEP
jgi:crossover junction endodeoxyribonuclease RuvC